jgi:TrmH family RNA methyltransferase
MNHAEIRSAANPRFRLLLELASSSRARREKGVALIEGDHLGLAWIESGASKAEEVILPRRSLSRPGIGALCEKLAHALLVLDDGLFDRLSQVEHGPGPLILIPVVAHSLPPAVNTDAVYCDGIQDPGNVGTIMRSAAAFGVKIVIASAQTADVWSPKVLRAAMGAHFQLQMIEDIPVDALIAAAGQVRISAADPRGGVRLDAADLRSPRIWVFGSEGRGLSAAFDSVPALERLRIPQSQAVESLNVATAAAVCLYEQYRQRLGPP